MSSEVVYTLGLELSTQSAKAVVLDTRKGVVFRADIPYDRHFARYGTRQGVLPHADPRVRHTSPHMLTAAVDALFARLRDSGLEMQRVAAIKADAMQHAAVYVNDSLPSLLAGLSPRQSLVEALAPVFTRATIPIWEDRSAAEEAIALASALIAAGGIRKITANDAEPRFLAAQIMKWGREQPDEYHATHRILMLSAYISSILTAAPASADTGDGWGTNLNTADLCQPGWSEVAVNAAESYFGLSGLMDKLGGMVPFNKEIGVISGYFVERYGLSRNVRVLAGTGDNPATLAGCAPSAVVSLGSSYTVLGAAPDLRLPECPVGNVFGYANQRAMALTCFTNGGKLHDSFRRENAAASKAELAVGAEDWSAYVAACGAARLTADEGLMLPYLYDESVPLCPAGIVRDRLEPGNGPANIRALHLSQALALARHSRHLGSVASLAAVGGGAANPFLCQCLADTFGTEIRCLDDFAYSAPFGCAVSAAAAVLDLPDHEAARLFAGKPVAIYRPLPENRSVVAALAERYAHLEESRLARK